MSYIPLSTDANDNALVRSSQHDIYDTPIVGERTNTVIAQFINYGSNTIGDILNIVNSGGSTAVMANGTALFSSGAGTTTSLTAKTHNSVIYNPGFEIYSSICIGFTTPTSVNSTQYIGIWDIVNNGFYLGFNGTTFGTAVMSGGVATFTPRSSWSEDLLDGNAASKFTRNGIPEAINFTYQNVFRIRYGWYGSSPVMYEVFSPDGAWIVFHTIKHLNTSTVTSIQNPNLPVSLQITKTGADATNISMRSGSWTAGSTSPKTVDITNYKEVNWTSSTPTDSALIVNAILSGSASIAVDITGTISAGVINFEKSPDGTTWYPLTIGSIADGLFTSRNLALGNAMFEMATAGSYQIRVRLSTPITGLGSVNIMVRPSSVAVNRYIEVYQADGAQLHTVIDSGSVSVTTSTTASAPAAATVGIASAQIVASNPARRGLVLINTSNAIISFGLSGHAAVLKSGITLTPYGTWTMDQFTFTTGAIAAIASIAASNVAIQELT